MNKKLKLSLCIGIPAVILIVAALALFLPGGVLNNSADNTGAQSGKSSQSINLENYNKVQRNMTYDEVKEILGTDGELVANDGDTPAESDYLTTYRWYGEHNGAVAVMSFLEGKLTSKTHVGLT